MSRSSDSFQQEWKNHWRLAKLRGTDREHCLEEAPGHPEPFSLLEYFQNDEPPVVICLEVVVTNTMWHVEVLVHSPYHCAHTHSGNNLPRETPHPRMYTLPVPGHFRWHYDCHNGAGFRWISQMQQHCSLYAKEDGCIKRECKGVETKK